MSVPAGRLGARTSTLSWKGAGRPNVGCPQMRIESSVWNGPAMVSKSANWMFDPAQVNGPPELYVVEPPEAPTTVPVHLAADRPSHQCCVHAWLMNVGRSVVDGGVGVDERTAGAHS